MQKEKLRISLLNHTEYSNGALRIHSAQLQQNIFSGRRSIDHVQSNRGIFRHHTTPMSFTRPRIHARNKLHRPFAYKQTSKQGKMTKKGIHYSSKLAPPSLIHLLAKFIIIPLQE
ncbi:hypothetical protein TcG_06510 [Trypanosoma cruzi]|nr:hypothetical protein TcG_06510 [Trypanosoma cruzi]